MPSNRRMRGLLYAAFAFVFFIIYMTSSARQARSHDFRSRTVDRMREKDADDAEVGRKMSEHLREAESAAKKGADAKFPKPNGESQDHLAEVEVEDESRTDRAHVRGSKQNKEMGKKPWTKVEESKEEVKEELSAEDQEVETELGSILKRSPIIIFSKTYCPFSQKAKNILVDKYKIVPAPFVVELDKHNLGEKLQAALEKTTGRRTVPNILISGKSIGGGDDVAALDTNGELLDTIRKMAGKRIMEAKLNELGSG